MSDEAPLMIPDLSGRPHTARVERVLAPSPARVYAAFTTEWERWFAQPGTATMEAAVGRPFFFETRHQDTRYPHYGRFLRLDPNKLVELTWLTGARGTGGAETVLTVRLAPATGGTKMSLTHAGFYDAAAARQHEQAWQGPVLDELDRRFGS